MRRLFLISMLALAGVNAAAAPLPYDESANAPAEVQRGLAAAQAQHRDLLLIFGANWCEDCRALDKALKTGRNAELVGQAFEVVKVDVGRFNRNMDLAKAYGNATAKGIPAAVVLSADGQVLYATRAGELADARRMSETGIYDFFEGVVKRSRGAR